MALNSLKIATDGYLKKTTKVALVIAVAGYLNFTDVPPNPPSGGGGGGGYSQTYGGRHEQLDKEDKNKIAIEDSQIIAIVQLCLKTTII